MLDPMTKTHIGTNNKPFLTISNELQQAPKVLKSTTMGEVTSITPEYNARENQTPRRIIRTGIAGYTPVTSLTRDVDGSGITDVSTSNPP